ncbi:MAG: membrane protein insertion efficiency factor YidD [Chthoniobacterales bacterium]|nr:membrane protein insertion efficiency factor YidD [Chthoniobacterales bacterium]
MIAAVVFTAAAIFDWSRPPAAQWSARLYENVVVVGYRAVVRPVTKHFIRCRFEPTCSQYSAEAVRAYGFPIGLAMTSKRLLRCMPWIPFGTRDPVPLPATAESAAQQPKRHSEKAN